jgi:hypothetical protein
LGRVVVVAAKGCIVGDVVLVQVGVGGILEDGDLVVSAAGLRLVAGAAKGALRVIQLRALNGVTAKADAVVLEAGITEAVALANSKA